MSALLRSLVFFLLVTQISFAQWHQQNSGTDKNLYSVRFIDANNGFAVGDSGIILRTTDAGNNWEIQPSGTITPLNDIYFIDADKGWIVGGGNGVKGIILNTTNGGENWFNQLDTTMDFFRSVSFIDSDNGWAVGPCTVSKTTNGGTYWIDLLSGCSNFIHFDVCFNNADTGIVVGYTEVSARLCVATTARTSNAGSEWYYEDLPGAENGTMLSSICIAGSNTIFSAGGKFISYGIIAKTTDWGITWTSENIEGPPFNDVYFTDETYGWIAGGKYGGPNGQSLESIILGTTDGGDTWMGQMSDTLNVFRGLFFIDLSNGWVVGDNGAVYHTTNGGVSVEEEKMDEIPNEFLLSQNFPNPFNPSTKIKYSVPNSSEVVMKVFDILGNEIETLVNEEKRAGIYELTWYSEGLPSGVYFYQIKTGEFIQTKKMLLLK